METTENKQGPEYREHTAAVNNNTADDVNEERSHGEKQEQATCATPSNSSGGDSCDTAAAGLFLTEKKRIAHRRHERIGPTTPDAAASSRARPTARAEAQASHLSNTAFGFEAREPQSLLPSSLSERPLPGRLLVDKEAVTSRAHDAALVAKDVGQLHHVSVLTPTTATEVEETDHHQESELLYGDSSERERLHFSIGDSIISPPPPLGPDAQSIWTRRATSSSVVQATPALDAERSDYAETEVQSNQSDLDIPMTTFHATASSSTPILVASLVVEREEEQRRNHEEYRRTVHQELISEAVQAQVVVVGPEQEEESGTRTTRRRYLWIVALLMIVAVAVVADATLGMVQPRTLPLSTTEPTMAPKHQQSIPPPTLVPTAYPTSQPKTDTKFQPTLQPNRGSTLQSTDSGTMSPTGSPLKPMLLRPTHRPTLVPTTIAPSMPTFRPTLGPTGSPSTSFSATTSTAWWEQAKLEAVDDRAQNDRFGDCIAIHGDTLAVGAPWDDNQGGDSSGAVYVFTRKTTTSWELQAKLTANDGAAARYFGNSVAMDNDTIVIGATGGGRGAVYVFARTAGSGLWTQQAKIEAPDSAWNQYFGFSVDVNGDNLIVGDHFYDVEGGGFQNMNMGAAYVFVRTFDANKTPYWTLQGKLAASDGAGGDHFGISVAIDGDSVVVGAWSADNAKGSAYVFVKEEESTLSQAIETIRWIQEAKLMASDGAKDDQFGFSVDVDGDTVVVGAHFDDDNGSSSGSVYLFERTTSPDAATATKIWNQQGKLRAGDGLEGDNFGTSVALHDNLLVVGAPGEYNSVLTPGAVYVFVQTFSPAGSEGKSSDSNSPGWIEQAKLTATDGEIGWRVAIDTISGTIATCAEYDSIQDGGAFVFEVEAA